MSAVANPPAPPTLGIIGTGQLARMLALAAVPLGVRCRFLVRGDHGAVAPFTGVHAADDRAAFMAGLDALTTEIENVDAATLDALQAVAGPHTRLWPPATAIASKRDRRAERRLLAGLDLPQGAWVATPDPEHPGGAARAAAVLADLHAAVDQVGLPCRIKAAIGGYDGRGQWRITARADLAAVDPAAAPFVVEAEVAFDAELSVIGAFAGSRAAPRCWTPAINTHRSGILARSIVAASGTPDALRQQAEALLATLGHALDYRGVLALELYRVGERLLINEFAPRVHNSGHWTLEGAACSQFENHVRAVLGMPLGDTGLRGPCVSWNVIGRWPDRDALLRIPGLALHDYAKAPRAGRKLGHLTLRDAGLDDDRARVVEAALAAVADDRPA